jgi:UDP:flavonoid glycosyltransferase YjiC (YdhE family)
VALPGHFFPLVPLAWAFRALGHDVLVATPDNFAAAVVRAGLPVVSCGPTTNFVARAESGGSVEERRFANGRTFGEFAASSLPGTLDLVRTWRPDLVVSERAEFAGPIAARAHDVPAVEFQWSVATLGEYRTAASAVLGDALAGLELAALPEPARVVTSWPASLRKQHAADHIGMRHVPYNGDSAVPSWLWEPRTLPRICFTMGTVLPHLDPERAADAVLPVLHKLSELDAEFVVAVDDKVADAWPDLPSAIRHRGRLPLSLVLPTCAVAIHHGGHGTALTALDAGASQLVLPVFDDQLDNADAVVRSGAGLSLSSAEMNPDAVVDRCAKLIEDGAFRVEAAVVAAEIASQPSPVETAQRLHTLVAHRARTGRAA